MDVGDDTTARDGRLDEGVELLVTADGELQVTRRDALHLKRGKDGEKTGRGCVSKNYIVGSISQSTSSSLNSQSTRAAECGFPKR